MLIALTAAEPMARALSEMTRLPMAVARVERFSNDQRAVDLSGCGMAGRTVHFVQDFGADVHGRLVELFLALDAASRGGATRVGAVLPYLPYGRSDQAPFPGARPGLSVIAGLLCTAGIGHLVTATPHSVQAALAFTCPLTLVDATETLAAAFAGPAARVVVSPDIGGAKRAARLAARLGCEVAVVEKLRKDGGQRTGALWGYVEGRTAVLLDDEVNSARSLVQAAELLAAAGATRIEAAVTHNLLTEDGVSRLAASPIARLVTTDSRVAETRAPMVEVRPLTKALAAALVDVPG